MQPSVTNLRHGLVSVRAIKNMCAHGMFIVSIIFMDLSHFAMDLSVCLHAWHALLRRLLLLRCVSIVYNHRYMYVYKHTYMLVFLVFDLPIWIRALKSMHKWSSTYDADTSGWEGGFCVA